MSHLIWIYSVCPLVFDYESFSKICKRNFVICFFGTLLFNRNQNSNTFITFTKLHLRVWPAQSQTSSSKGNNRSPDSKSLKYFEQCSSKRFFNWSRAANSKVHGRIQPNFKLIPDYLLSLLPAIMKKIQSKMKALEC